MILLKKELMKLLWIVLKYLNVPLVEITGALSASSDQLAMSNSPTTVALRGDQLLEHVAVIIINKTTQDSWLLNLLLC